MDKLDSTLSQVVNLLKVQNAELRKLNAAVRSCMARVNPTHGEPFDVIAVSDVNRILRSAGLMKKEED